MMNIPYLCDALIKSYKGYIRLAVMLIVIIVTTINTITVNMITMAIMAECHFWIMAIR